jgi:hypothetical protein
LNVGAFVSYKIIYTISELFASDTDDLIAGGGFERLCKYWLRFMGRTDRTRLWRRTKVRLFHFRGVLYLS